MAEKDWELPEGWMRSMAAFSVLAGVETALERRRVRDRLRGGVHFQGEPVSAGYVSRSSSRPANVTKASSGATWSGHRTEMEQACGF